MNLLLPQKSPLLYDNSACHHNNLINPASHVICIQKTSIWVQPRLCSFKRYRSCQMKEKTALSVMARNPWRAWWASTLKVKFWSTHIICSLAYQSKALELEKLIAPSLYQSAHQGYAGIGCQLHHLKTKDLMMGIETKTRQKNDMQGQAHEWKAHRVVNSIIPTLWQSAVSISKQYILNKWCTCWH